MYRVLLADDEPIILSGLQSMPDWEKLNCAVVGTARNGKQALDLIKNSRPDIVICDINMPLTSGLWLLEVCAEQYPEIAFIMLTNHQDFRMAQQSLRSRAADYLLKIDLSEKKLEQSIQLAIAEREKRRRLGTDGESAPEHGSSPMEMIRRCAEALLTADGKAGMEQAVTGLDRLGAARQCAVVQLVMDPAGIPDISTFSGKERSRLFQFHRSLVEDTAQKFFQGQPYVLPKTSDSGSMLFFFWRLESTELISRFHVKLVNTLSDISQMGAVDKVGFPKIVL